MTPEARQVCAGRAGRGETLRRYGLFLLSLFMMGVAVAVMKRSGIGLFPTASVANILSVRFTSLSIGTWTLLWNLVIIMAQVVVLRKKFQLIQLLQVPVSILFGLFVDCGMWMTACLQPETYGGRIALVLSGTAIISVATVFAVVANVVMNSGEALVKAVADTTGRAFGNVKVCLDVLYVALTAGLSMLFFHGEILALREGTVIAALSAGWIVKLLLPILKKPLEKWLVP